MKVGKLGRTLLIETSSLEALVCHATEEKSSMRPSETTGRIAQCQASKRADDKQLVI